MRTMDIAKISGKAAKTVMFDKHVLAALEKRAKEQKTTVSNLINDTARHVMLTDFEFYTMMAQHHWMEFSKYKYLKDQEEVRIMSKVEVSHDRA